MHILLVSDLHYTLPQLDWLTRVAPSHDLIELPARCRCGADCDVAISRRASDIEIRAALNVTPCWRCGARGLSAKGGA